MAVGFHAGISLGGTHQLKSVGLWVFSRVAENVAVLHPRRHHAELVSVHRNPMERENVGMVQAFPQQYFLTKPLNVVVSSQRDGPTKIAITFVVLLLSSSGANLNALTATFLPRYFRFHRSVYPRVAKGISSCVLRSSSIR